MARIHFTVSPEHVAGFEELLAEKVPFYEKRFGIRYDISFSVQKPPAADASLRGRGLG